jgi:putative flippase GtrA
VSTISGLYERFRQLIHEGAKFLVVGLIGTIVTFGLANALKSMGEYKAIAIATIVATVVTYLGNGRWAFRNRKGQGTARDSVMFFVLNAVGLLIYWGCIGVTDLAGVRHEVLWYNIALVVGTGLGTLFRFWSYRKWVWVAADTPVFAQAESPEDRAQDLAAMVGAAPITHHSADAHGDPGDNVPARPRTPGAHRRS